MTDDAVDFLPLIYPSAAVGKKMSESGRSGTRGSSPCVHSRDEATMTSPRNDANSALAVHALRRGVWERRRLQSPSRAPRRALLRFRRASVRNLPLGPSPGADSVRPAKPASGAPLDRTAARAPQRGQRGAAARHFPSRATPLEAPPAGPRRDAPLHGRYAAARGRGAGLIAVHGQAMAWVLFLPSDQQRCAAVEIFPQGLSRPIYRDLSATLGVHYESLTARASCALAEDTATRLQCNVTVGIETTVERPSGEQPSGRTREPTERVSADDV